jgi:hypothetical protein
MRRSTAATFALSLWAAGLLLSSPAHSCIAYQDFRIESVKNAALVFRGRVIDYEPAIQKWIAAITFSVVEMYRGDRRPRLRLTWRNSTFELPRTWNQPKELIVAAEPNVPPDVFQEPFGVLQEACSSPFLLNDTAENRMKVRALVGM